MLWVLSCLEEETTNQTLMLKIIAKCVSFTGVLVWLVPWDCCNKYNTHLFVREIYTGTVQFDTNFDVHVKVRRKDAKF